MSLYLFVSNLAILAVSADDTGSRIPTHGSEIWSLRGPIAEADLAPDIVATEKERGFCLLDTDDLKQNVDGASARVAA